MLIVLCLNSCSDRESVIDSVEPNPKSTQNKIKFLSYKKPIESLVKNSKIKIKPLKKEGLKIKFEADSFCIKYPKACENFIENFNEKKEEYKEIINNKNGLDQYFVISIVSPEIAYYNSINNKLETLATETFYVQLGSDYNDFSIGKFQMKPSFIELLESRLFDFPELNDLAEKLKIDDENSIEIRKKRIYRLKDPTWQIIYLCAFCSYMDLKFSNLSFNSKREKILFYASAYNTGFDKPYKEIVKFINKRFFPNGKSNTENNFSYAAVALMFYDKLINFN